MTKETLDDELDPVPAIEEETPTDEPKDKDPRSADRLAGKTREDILEMYMESQKQISRQGNEIGDMRRVLDDVLRKQLESATPKEPEPKPDWYEDPEKAAEKLVTDKVSAIEAKLDQETTARNLREFEQKHPGFRDTAASEDFREWVVKSTIRTRMYDTANAGDLEVADELFTEWDSYKKAQAPKEDESKESAPSRNDNLRKASMETGGGAPATKKIYRRADIRNLRLRDPEAYAAREAEFHLAYQEGRVR
jgi:hypothetical protein